MTDLTHEEQLIEMHLKTSELLDELRRSIKFLKHISEKHKTISVPDALDDTIEDLESTLKKFTEL